MPHFSTLDKNTFNEELNKLQVELNKLQAWVTHAGVRIIIVFEGRDGAGKGSMIRSITERVDPRTFRVEALPAPSDREKSQIYLQRYVERFPAGGEVVIFDRSWYNRAGVERVMGFCTEEQYRYFLDSASDFERWIIENDTYLLKYWMSVPNEQQLTRFQSRVEDPNEYWKLSPIDLDARRRWYDYARARDVMLDCSDTEHAPWNIVDCRDTRRSHLNCITHLLDQIPYEDVPHEPVSLPDRDESDAYDDEGALKGRKFVPEVF
jgi:polyphosphate kinase 2